MKNSREQIFNRIKEIKPAFIPLPQIPSFNEEKKTLVAFYSESLEAVGGKIIKSRKKKDLNALVTEHYPEVINCWSEVDAIHSFNIDKTTVTDAHDLKDLELVVIKGTFGVAENGAIWISAAHLPFRALPFITKHLMIVIEKSSLVLNMHEAYKLIDPNEKSGFGVFISGPSKTADIEQSLVIGAHGSKSLTVVLI